MSGDTLRVPEMLGDPPGGLEVSGEPPGGPEVVGRPSRRFGSGREILPKFLKWSEEPIGGPKVVEIPFCVQAVVMRTSRRSISDRDRFRRPEVVGRPSRRSGRVGRPSWRSGSGRETLLEVWKW